jgi:MFS family permease
LTTRPDAGPGVDVSLAAGATVRHPAIFFPLFVPFGLSAGYVSVTLGFQLAAAGLSTGLIATLVALSIWPQTWKMLWAPVVDTIGNPKLWYGVGAAGVGGTILAMTLIPATARQLPALSLLVVASSVASTLVSMASEVFMAHSVPPVAQGRASGWAQAGNFGGSGIGGGLGLYLAQHVHAVWVSGAVLTLLCFACWACVLFLPPAPRVQRPPRYFDTIVDLLRDVWSTSRLRIGYLALIIMLLPIASGGATGLWPAIAGEWHAGADLVALVNGVIGGLTQAVGCLIGGYVCDRMDEKSTYCLFGLLAGMVAVLMAWAPRTPAVFVVFTLVYGVMIGGGYAAYSAVVLKAIGKGAAATKFNLMAAVSNVPIALMTTFDGWMHDRGGSTLMLYGELAAPAAAIAGFALFAYVTRPRRAIR